MSIDTTFKPMSMTYAVDNTAAVQIKEASQIGAVTFRIRAVTASGYISWGGSGVAAATAPAIGSPKPNTLGVTLGAVVYLELPSNSFFIGNAAFATSGFEVTAGQGGVGG
jgi:hypothetical protein